LADGCFDPLHDGHVAYLAAARALGTRLVVNLATDEEIWEKRPRLGPFLPLAIRRELVLALRAVDEVTVLDTAEALRQVRPAIYVKGADWAGRLPRVERELCQALNIEIRLVDTMRNSSTALLASFLEQASIAQRTQH
jgi:cytidyltransferase-like protein